MAVEFKKAEEIVSTSLGTISDFIGAKGKIGFREANLNNPDKRLVVVLAKEDGTQTQITCSNEVSKGVRNKSITVGQLAGFEVKEYTNEETRDVYNLVVMPTTGSNTVFFSAEEIVVQKYERPKMTETTLKSLLALA